jgi:hypothetical protein
MMRSNSRRDEPVVAFEYCGKSVSVTIRRMPDAAIAAIVSSQLGRE